MKSYDQIKNQLQAFESDLDKEKLWANTAHAIPKRKRRYGLIYILLFGAVLLGSGIFFLLPSLSSTQDTATAESMNVVPPALQDQQQGLTASTVQQDGLIENDSDEMQAQHTGNVTPSADDLVTADNTFTTKKETQRKPSENQSVKEKTLPAAVAPQAEMYAQSETSDGRISEVEISDQEQFLIDLAPASNERAFQEEVSVADLALLPILPLTINPSDPAFLTGSNTTVVRGKYRKTFALYASQAIGASSLSVGTDSDELLAEKNFVEDRVSSLENLSTRIGAQLHLSKRWVVGAGLQWNQLTTRTDFVWTEEERLMGDGITGIVIDPDGTQYLQSGVIGITRASQWEASRYSTHSTVNLEAQIAYQVFRHYRFDLLAGLHGTYNLLYRSEGSTFDIRDQPVRYTSEDQPYTLTSPFNIGMSVTGSYQLGRRIGLQLMLQYDRLNYEQFIDQSTLDYKHNILSMGLGLRYKL